MSHFGKRGRGRHPAGPNRGGMSHSGGSSNRTGLLGAAPVIPGLMDSFSSRGNQNEVYEQDLNAYSGQEKPGLLGIAPGEGFSKRPRPSREQQNFDFKRQQNFFESNRRDSFSYNQEENFGKKEQSFSNKPVPPPGPDRLTPQVRQIMTNLGLTKGDMEQLSLLPDEELSTNNLANVINQLRGNKSRSNVQEQKHDLRQVIDRSNEGSHRSFEADFRSSSDEPYDPSEPTDDGFNSSHQKNLFDNQGASEDKFSNFEQKWYSESSKKQNERSEVQTGSSILRGSRGPAAKSSAHWEREEHGLQQLRSMSPSPRRRSPLLHLQSQMPPPMHRRASPPMLQRRASPSPRREPSPPALMSLPRRMTPPPKRMPSPPRRMSPPRPAPRLRGGLLGDPRDPSTQELDFLASSVGNGRNVREKRGRSMERHLQERQRIQEPNRRGRSPPLLRESQPQGPGKKVFAAQMKAVREMKIIGGGSRIAIDRKGMILAVDPSEAQQEAARMRARRGRVLYLRYQAGRKGVIVDEDIVKLAQPFGKVTNILLVLPKTIASGWFQAFVELEEYDGAAAMLEHYMVRPPTVKNIQMQVQKSNHQTLKLREDQMNRDFSGMAQKNIGKRRRALSSDRSRKSLSSDRSGKKPKSGTNSDSKDDKSAPPKKDHASSRRSPRRTNSKEKTTDKANGDSEKSEKEKKDDEKETAADKDAKKPTESATESSEAPSESFRLVDEIIEKMDQDIIQKAVETTVTDEDKKAMEALAEKEKAKKAAQQERLNIIQENIEQSSTMLEEVMKNITDEEQKEVISEALEYLADSLGQIKELEE